MANSGSTVQGSYGSVYNKVAGSQSVVTGGISGRTITQPHSMDYSALSGGTTSGATKTAPSPIIVEFGGMKWSAVYLTTNTTMTTNGSPDLVLTLLATENSTQTYRYSAHNKGYTAGGYAGNIYSTSYIREIGRAHV